MPSQLLARIGFIDNTVANDINPLEGRARVDNPVVTAEMMHHQQPEPPRNTVKHWRAGTPTWGNVLNRVKSIVIHATAGWPSYESAPSFQQRFNCTGRYSQPGAGQNWVKPDRQGIGTQYFIEPNGTFYNLIGTASFSEPARLTWHAEHMNTVSLGIENANFASVDHEDPYQPMPRESTTNPRRLARLRDGAASSDEDLVGMQLYGLQHPGHAPDLNLVWHAVFPAYDGPGDIESARFTERYNKYVEKTLFTEQNYRKLARLCRFLLERHDLPRNFPLLPYASRHFDRPNKATFRSMLMADPLFEQIAAELELTPASVRNNTFVYSSSDLRKRLWGGFFKQTGTNPCFLGLISHFINGGNVCPGPFFEWHRFAREVWDWWWYPFDIDPGSPPQPATTEREYRRARGTTPLIEYYFDVQEATRDGSAYDDLKVPWLPGADVWSLPQETPLYAMANGVAIAARLSPTGSPDAPGTGFLLTRHEVFHRGRSGRAALAIDYDRPPTQVWTLITFLSCDGFSTTDRTMSNPDWLNRFVIRKRECELAVQFIDNIDTRQPPNMLPQNVPAWRQAFRRAWNYQPPGEGQSSTRPSTGDSIRRDDTVYRELGAHLAVGDPVHFPRENAAGGATPVNVLLGDYLGTPGFAPPGPDGGARGVVIEIFSLEELSVPGAVRGTVSAVEQLWWRDTTSPARSEVDPNAQLPANGEVWRYPMTAFLHWLNERTWESEWRKYGAVDAQTNQPVPRPARPNSRRVV
jgi:N-acetylmuramoyl-L-alanine amidase